MGGGKGEGRLLSVHADLEQTLGLSSFNRVRKNCEKRLLAS